MANGQGAQAGAALGTAIYPGVGTAIGGLAGSLLDSPSKASSNPSGPMTSAAAVYGSGLDSSGWNVNFGGTQTNGSNKNGNPSVAETLGLSGGGGMFPRGINANYLLIGALIVGVLIWKKSRSKA